MATLWDARSRRNSNGRADSLRWPTKISVASAIAGQLLYLVLVAAWLFRWVRFYPGAPVPTNAIVVGLILALVALIAGVFSQGLTRWATMFAAVMMIGLWLLAAVASAAV